MITVTPRGFSPHTVLAFSCFQTYLICFRWSLLPATTLQPVWLPVPVVPLSFTVNLFPLHQERKKYLMSVFWKSRLSLSSSSQASFHHAFFHSRCVYQVAQLGLAPGNVYRANKAANEVSKMEHLYDTGGKVFVGLSPPLAARWVTSKNRAGPAQHSSPSSSTLMRWWRLVFSWHQMLKRGSHMRWWWVRAPLSSFPAATQAITTNMFTQKLSELTRWLTP